MLFSNVRSNPTLSPSLNPRVRNETSTSPVASGVASGVTAGVAAIAVQRFPVSRNDESLSKAEIGLMLAALSTLVCSIMLGVLIP